MEVKIEEAWSSVDGAIKYVTGWVWWAAWVLWPVIILCLVLSGIKDILMIGQWVPNVGEPLYWALVAACFWAVTNSKKVA